MVSAIVGVLSILMLDAEDRPAGVGGKVKAVLRGYPYTIGLALTFAMMLIFAPIMKAQSLKRRWSDAHVPIFLESEDYREVFGDVEHALHEGGLETRREPATWMVRAPSWILSFFAGSALSNYVAKELTALRGDDLEVVLHPSDLIVRGREKTVARIRAILERTKDEKVQPVTLIVSPLSRSNSHAPRSSMRTAAMRMPASTSLPWADR